MAGFRNEVLYAENVDFSGGDPIVGKVTTNGQLLIGSTAAPNIRVGTLTSTGGSLSITNGAGTINIESGSSTATTFNADTGSATPSANVIVLAGGTNGIDTTASGNTVTFNFDITEQPAIPTSVVTPSGTATPALNVLTLANGAGISITGAGSTVTIAINGATVGQTITGDSGGALSPTAGNWNILGGPGVTTSGSGSTLTINSVVFTDQAGSTSVTSDSGSFATAAITLTLPATPAQGELVQFACTTSNALVVDAPSTHLIRIGSLVSSAGGTATSTSIGDSVTLRYYAASTTWIATSVVGTWVMA